MAEFTSRHRKFIAEFIEMYKSYPTLWNLKSPEYSDRDKKHLAYSRMVEKLQEIEPDCDKMDVIKKINSLRSAFRREYRKVRRLKTFGRTYRPKLWYYDLIYFTVNSTGHKQKRVENTERDVIDTDTEPFTDSLSTSLVKQEEEDPFIDNCVDFEVDESNIVNNEGLNRIFKSSQDEFDAIGFNVASKLRTMDRTQRIIAERIIAETLFQGQMGTLNVKTPPINFTPVIHCNGPSNSSA